ncbi:serine/threonine-protein kinase [Actinokineospora pegani]|uniref:serine/threonine-protein kinase n=1 Tax=Actinokineospora pegani TaxID=2654637 RepID=UPI0012E9CCE5|nr:serine/threonine-protein kinase [Actinokineospora pegani]
MSEREQTGRVVGGRFELLGPLGSGGMGTVWRALDVGLRREVAIKEVRPADAGPHQDDPVLAGQQRERALRESRALARLQHPNVVSIYQIIETDDSPYPWIVMELVRGASLDERLRAGPLAPAEAARIGRDVLGALRAAHAAGVLHRDVKPGNVLLRPDGGAVLTDFGIAALHGSTQLTRTGEVIGSPEYIAPERLRGDETKAASDLWSLAMLLYVGVEGHHPLRRATTMATLAAVMSEPVPPPRRAGALGPVLSAVLVHDPAARPTGEVLDRMLAAAEHGPPTPAGPAFPAHTGQWHQRPTTAHTAPTPTRKRVGAAVFSATALALVAALALLLVNTLRSDDDPSNTRADPPNTRPAALPGADVPTTPPPGTTTSTPAPQDPLSPAGARQVVSALAEVMGGTTVSRLTIHPQHARATAPVAAPAGAFDDFSYRDGVATREGPDRVDPDRGVLDLDDVDWDALPALWQRATTELGVPTPTSRYIIIDTGLIDKAPSVRLYVADEYGGGYLLATLDGEVVKLFPRDG